MNERKLQGVEMFTEYSHSDIDYAMKIFKIQFDIYDTKS